MLDTHIVCGTNEHGKNRAIVDDQNALVVSLAQCPPLIKQQNKIFRSYFLNSSGSNDMGIDGSSTSVKFYISADDENDKYITAVSFLVGYGSAAYLFEFSDSGAALTNGFKFYYQRQGEEVDIHDAVKANYDLIRLAVKDILPTAWELRNLGALNDYGYLVTIDILSMMPPFGLKLDRGSSQKLVFEVRDDNTDADTMNAIAYGFERFE